MRQSTAKKESVISREPASQRTSYRVHEPIWVEIDQRKYRARDWNVKGLAVEEFEGMAKIGSELLLNIILPFQGYNVTLNNITAEVIRVHPDTRALAIRFVHLQDNQRETIEYFANCLISGKMAIIGDTLRNLDIPVTPVSKDYDAKPGAPTVVPKHSTLKAWLMGLVYLLCSLALLSYLFSASYNKFFRVSADNAVVTSPTKVLESPFDGLLTQQLVTEGSMVKQGDPLITLVSNHRDDVVQEANTALSKAQQNVAELEAELRTATEKAAVHNSASTHKSDAIVIKTRIATLKNQLRLDQAHLNRVKAAQTQGGYLDPKRQQHVYGTTFDKERLQAEAAYQKTQDKIKIEESKLAAELAVAQPPSNQAISPATKRYLAVLEERIKGAKQRLQAAEQQLATAQSEQAGLTLTAPHSGQVVALYGAPNAPVSKGKPLLKIEKLEKSIEAYLAPSLAAQIALGSNAEVLVPAINAQYRAQVTNISGETMDQAARFNHDEANNPVMPVKIQLKITETTQQQGELLKSGMPAIVNFEKSSTNSSF